MPLGINPFSAITSKLFAGTTGVLLVLLTLSHCSDKRHTRQRDEARAERDMAERASKQNEAEAKAQIAALEAKYTARAKENVRVETEIRTVYRDRADAYRMRQDRVCVGQTSAPGESPDPAKPDSPGPDAVILTRDDFEQLVENSARLEAAHRWAQSLIDDGTAEAVKAGVPEVGF